MIKTGIKNTLLLLSLVAICFLSPAVMGQTRLSDSLGEIKLDQQQLAEFEKMNPDDKKRMFCGLQSEQKRELLIQLPDKEKQLVFDCLMAEDKSWVLQQLGPLQTVTLFSGLDDIEQRAIFTELEDEVKRLFLEKLSFSERNKWLLMYPELEQLLAETPDSQPEGKESEQEELPLETKPSRIEKILSGAFPEEIDRQLGQFGYDFFEKRDALQAPADNVPVGDGYLVGPGDRFTIYLWGKVEHAYPVSVLRDGSIIIPRIGNLVIGGLTLGEAKSFLRSQFSAYYPDFEMNIIMDELRSIQVYIVGEAANPGSYTLNSLSTVLTALSASGGPGKNGSLRKMQVVRSGGEKIEIDLYDFFIFGRKSSDIHLRTGDTLFIPVIGPVAGVAGNVRRPAIYELKGSETIDDIMTLSGGVMPFGYLQNIVVERIQNNRRRVIKSFNIDPALPDSQADLQMRVFDGDVVKIYPVHRQMDQVVYLEGHVKYPREYEFNGGMRLSEILTGYDILLPEPYLPRAEIFRLMEPDLHPRIVGFNLGELLSGDGSHDLVLKDRDRIKIYSSREKMEVPNVSIKGAVNAPGLYRLYANMTVKDLIFRAGNLSNNAYKTEAALSRIVPGESKTETITIKFSPDQAIIGSKPDDMALKPHDSIFIREIPQFELAKKRQMMLEGEFVFPGEYSYAEGERISSVIRRAGGLTEDAYVFGAVFLREDVKTIQQERLKDYINSLEEDVLTLTVQATQTSLDRDEAEIITNTLAAKKQLLEKMKNTEPTGRMVLNLERVLSQPNAENDFKLQPGDRLIIGKIPSFVNVLGEVYNPTAMTVQPGKKVGYYIDRVGGPTNNADRKQIYLVRADGTVISKNQEGFFGIASWDSDRHRWTMGGFESLDVYPGDAIIVPKKVDKYSWLRLTKSVTEILYQIAVAAGVLVVAF
ncbi:MAG: polysaccharide biosynthesis protein [Desulfobacteraceae bacterium]|nr:polysaccharide biosynthesis protein [Desulfobacteraceae bacterium]